MSTITVASVVCLVVYHILFKVLAYWNALKEIGFHPGLRFLFSETGLAPFIIPRRTKYISPGRNSLFRQKHQDFKRLGCDVISYVSVYPISTWYFVADADIIREIVAARSAFPKPIESFFLYKALSFFGKNIVVSEAEEWKRFRKVANPGFSERNNRLVWEETQRAVLELFEEVWGKQKVVLVEDVLSTTVSIALFVISMAGFGQLISWKENGDCPPGYTMSFKETMFEVSTKLITKVITPPWLLSMGLTAGMRNTCVAFEHLEKYMVDMIHKRRSAEIKVDRHDLLSGLLDASEDDIGSYEKLTDKEVISNIFIFLAAGHETTAHTLCFAFALLALYPDEQENLYEHTRSILRHGNIPRYEDINSYTYALAVFYETLRLYPPIGGIPKKAAEDCVVYTTNEAGATVPVTFPKDCDILFDVPALHYNPKYWEDPEAFKPSRFLKPDWPRDAFMPFSGGARSCIGRRFSEVEGIAVLTLFNLHYQIELKEELQYAHETFEERKARLLAADSFLTLTPHNVPLVFKRRD